MPPASDARGLVVGRDDFLRSGESRIGTGFSGKAAAVCTAGRCPWTDARLIHAGRGRSRTDSLPPVVWRWSCLAQGRAGQTGASLERATRHAAANTVPGWTHHPPGRIQGARQPRQGRRAPTKPPHGGGLTTTTRFCPSPPAARPKGRAALLLGKARARARCGSRSHAGTSNAQPATLRWFPPRRGGRSNDLPPHNSLHEPWPHCAAGTTRVDVINGSICAFLYIMFHRGVNA